MTLPNLEPPVLNPDLKFSGVGVRLNPKPEAHS